ncbi:hypothetical protein CEXT_776751 [Caerostris extrusa]|uniref:Uncharacterized protein n=1 Tax=Caerostris extrusa TaxID=172846 RepID=A0AAV4WHY3_CAEEX|nr:hypothetical protein CEXT_776751 [Caerostris extrusa]
MPSANADSFPEEIFCIKGHGQPAIGKGVLGKYLGRNAFPPRSCVWRRPTDSLGTHQGFKGASETDSLSFSHLEPLLSERKHRDIISSAPGLGEF